MSKIEILMACPKDDIHIPANRFIQPIQVGVVLAPGQFEGMLHDDEGQNISAENPQYGNLTAQYWAWKHVNADYIGLFDYRHYLVFADSYYPANSFGDIIADVNDDAALEVLGITEQNMQQLIEQYDVIVPERRQCTDGMTVREQYAEVWYRKDGDLKTLCDVVDELYPEMMGVLNTVLDSKFGNTSNIFIMRKDVFNDYSAWLFAVLKEHAQRSDYSDYDPTSFRVSSYLAEILLSVYVEYLKQTTDYKIKELQRVCFEYVDEPKFLKPAFTDSGTEQEPVSVVFSANDYYVPYLSALLQSIKDNASAHRYYDLVVMHDDISERHQNILKRQMETSHISLRFFDVTYYMLNRGNNLALRGHFRIQTYFRLLLQDILPDWHKVLYLDADMIVLEDVADLFDVDLDNHLVAAVKDADTAGLYNGVEEGKKEYMDKVLKIKKPYDYFQAGTILFNLDEFRKQYTVDELFKFASSYEWQLLDQDVLNYFAQGQVKFVSNKWNVMMDWGGFRIKEIIGHAPRYMVSDYLEAHADPAICHYAGPDKPWEFPDSDLAEYFWEYARKTPFYEVILSRMAKKRGDEACDELRAEDGPIKKVLRPTYEKILPAETKRRELVGGILARINGI